MLLVCSLTTEIFLYGKIAVFPRGHRRGKVRTMHHAASVWGVEGRAADPLTWSVLTFYCVWL